MKLKPILFAIYFFIFAFVYAQETDKVRRTLLYEAETFQFQANWTHSKPTGNQGSLLSNRSKYSPCTVISIPEAGKYYVWVSAFDHDENSPKSRRLKVKINDTILDGTAGMHGKAGFEWELVGSITTHRGNNILTLIADNPSSSATRCDAVILTKFESFNPVGKFMTGTERTSIRQNPRIVDVVSDNEFSTPTKYSDIEKSNVVTLENSKVIISFTEKKLPNVESAYVRSTQFKNDSKVFVFNEEQLFISYKQKVKAYDTTYFLSWDSSESNPKIKIANKLYDINVTPFYPYSVGKNTLLYAVKAEKKSDNSVLLTYQDGTIARITLQENSAILKYEIESIAKNEGFYSIGFLGFNSALKTNFEAAEIPPLLTMNRLMNMPKMIPISLTSQPLALLETKINDVSYTNALVADPAELPFEEWSRMYNSKYGFSTSSPNCAVQPAIFTPIIGGRNSLKKSGETLKASFYVVGTLGDWTSMYEEINEKLFNASELREPYTASLAQAADNIATLLKDENFGAWSSHLKGRWNVEGEYMATQSSPLAELSIAVLSDDEDYYKNISLPTLQFCLSRKYFHFIPKVGEDHSVDANATHLEVPSTAWGADFFLSADKLSGGGNTWVKTFLENPYPRIRYSQLPDWTVLFGLYLVEPNPELLEKIKKSCDDWLKQKFHPPLISEYTYREFVNVTYYPYWWYLVDLYEVTQDEKYLNYAKQGAFHTLSALWNYPIAPKGNVQINKGNIAEGVHTVWWKGDKRYRMGYFETRDKVAKLAPNAGYKEEDFKYLYPIKEKTVPAMLVSRVGLGIEQPSTYLSSRLNYRNILMPSWAPEMLKVYQYTKTDILNKFSRHTIIGRYANFLGYYIRNYTDVMHDPQYPYKGPDITTFYYHHAPCHFAQTYDYLMAQLEERTQNKIKFPFLRQQGYVWFTDRIFGLCGKVFDDKNVRPILNLGAISADTPKVSVMTARAADGIWAMLMNDSATDIKTKLSFDASKKLLNGVELSKESAFYDNKGVKLYNKKINPDTQISIPALGLIAVKIPAAKFDVDFSQPPLPAESQIHDRNLHNAVWKELHAYRIRGPFGKDALYVILPTANLIRAKVTLLINGKESIVCDKFPYEFSVYPVAQDFDLSFKVKVEEESKPAFESKTYLIKSK